MECIPYRFPRHGESKAGYGTGTDLRGTSPAHKPRADENLDQLYRTPDPSLVWD